MNDGVLEDIREALMGRRLGGPTDLVKIDDRSAVIGSAMRIDFRRETFRRKRVDGQVDPPPELPLTLVNTFLSRLRSLTQAEWITTLEPSTATWAIEYTSDDGTLLPIEPDLMRVGIKVSGRVRLFGISKVRWKALSAHQPDFEPFVWDELLLDAEALLPRIGPVVVLAYSAIETFGEHLCNRLAKSPAISARLWEWIVDRGDYRKEPSTADFLDTLLQVTAGKSLKAEEPGLWTAFTQIREARNNYVHRGRATDKKDARLTVAQARELLGNAKRIVTWLESLAPPELRRTFETDTAIEVALHFR